MKFEGVVALFLLSCGTGVAAEFTALKVNTKISLAESCTDALCTVNVKAKVKASGELDITGPEAAGFNADTVVIVAGPAFEFQFRIGDDPKYQPGDTSANVAATVSSGAGLIPTSLKVNWANNKLVFSSTASGKNSATVPHVDELVSGEGTGKAGIGARADKSHEGPDLGFGFKAENLNVAFLEAEALVFGDSRIAIITEEDLAGKVTETQEVSIKSKAFSPAP